MAHLEGGCRAVLRSWHQARYWIRFQAFVVAVCIVLGGSGLCLWLFSGFRDLLLPTWTISMLLASLWQVVFIAAAQLLKVVECFSLFSVLSARLRSILCSYLTTI